ncbi:MAG TPA: hypothetical protein VH165_26620 [Kofleriaceae bacterium]|nr:hypothetical protein [Kofleriaceae bacterium]
MAATVFEDAMTAAPDGIVQRHAWLQKHPSPLAARGEFHWYPERGDRELRASFVERVRGVEPPAVLWQLERGRVAWGQVFAATAPLDGRRYIGLVLSAIEGDLPVAELLARLAPPPPAPWTDGVAIETPGRSPAVQELAAGRAARGDVAGVARALLSGGVANVDDPADAALPVWIASIERVRPEADAAPRCGVWLAGAADGARDRVAELAAAAWREPGSRAATVWLAGAADGARDRVAELAAAAWREPGSRAATAWTLLCELAIARGESIDRVGSALEAIAAGAVLTADERAELAGCDRVVDVLHAWGRGRLDRSPAAATLASRLADLVALRVLVQLAADRDASHAIAEARWYALLSAGRRKALLAAVAQRTASLRALVEAHHG